MILRNPTHLSIQAPVENSSEFEILRLQHGQEGIIAKEAGTEHHQHVLRCPELRTELVLVWCFVEYPRN